MTVKKIDFEVGRKSWTAHMRQSSSGVVTVCLFFCAGAQMSQPRIKATEHLSHSKGDNNDRSNQGCNRAVPSD